MVVPARWRSRTSSAERADRLRELGATHVLDRDGEGGPDAPAGYDVIIDVVAGADMPAFFARLNPNGRRWSSACCGYPPADFGTTMFAAFQKSMSFATFSAATVTDADRRAAIAELFAAAGRGELRSVVYEVLPLEQAALAHQKMAAGEVFGRIVLTPSGSRGRVLRIARTSARVNSIFILTPNTLPKPSAPELIRYHSQGCRV